MKLKSKEERDLIMDLMTVVLLLNQVLNILDENSDAYSDSQFDALLDSVLTALTKCEDLLKERL